MTSIARQELLGAAFIAVVGTALHFTYELSGRNPLVAPFSAVNESVWEHLKLVYWPAAFYSLIQLVTFRKRPPSFLTAKAASMVVMPSVIVTLFYASRLFIEESLLFDITLFYISIAIGQYTSVKVMKARTVSKLVTVASLLLIISMGLAFTYFTLEPPRVFLFRDPVTGSFGIGE
jgi:hypothetical protein